MVVYSILYEITILKKAGAIPISRSALCPCGSGKKYKRCCLKKDRVPAKNLPPWLPRLFDLLIIPCLIIAFAYEPNYAYGRIDYNELGQYLSTFQGLLHGRFLYKDIFVQYGPLQYYGPLWALLAFGKTLVHLKGYFLTGEILSFLAVYFLARCLIPRRLFAYAAALVAVVEAHHPFWSLNWGGVRFAFIYLCISGLLLFGKTGGRRFLFFAGLFASIGFLHTYDSGAVSYMAGIFFLFYYCFLLPADIKPHRNGTALFSYLAGVLLPLVALGVFLTTTHSLGAYWNQLKELGPARAICQPILAEDLRLKIFYPIIPYVAGFVLTAWSIIRAKNRTWETLRIFTVCCAGAFLYALSFRALLGPQFQSALPLAVVCLFYWMYRIYERLRINKPLAFGLGNRFNRTVLMAIFVLGISYQLFSEKRFYQDGLKGWLYYQSEKNHLLADYRQWRPKDEKTAMLKVPSGGNAVLPSRQAEEIDGTVAYILSHTGPNDAILGFPDLCIFNFFCDRPEITRFYINSLAAAKPEWRKEVLDALKRERPKMVLRSSRLSSIAQALEMETELMPEVSAYIEAHYRLVSRFGSILIYILS